MNSYRQTLQRVAERTLIHPEAFNKLDRRRRRRHRNRRIVSAVVALAVAAGGTWGALALLNVGKQPRPSTAPRLRTATANGITVTLPSRWTLVEFGRPILWSPHGPTPEVSFLELANFQPGLNPLLLCSGTAPMPPTGVLLYVHPSPGVRPWKPKPLPVDPILSSPGQGACGPGFYVDWSVAGAGFEAMIAFGPNASQSDRQALLASFKSLNFRWF